MANFFDVAPGSPPTKSGRPESPRNLPEKKVQAWVMEGVGGALQHFGTKVEERVQAAEDKFDNKLKKLKKELVDDFNGKLAAVEAQNQNLRNELEKFKKSYNPDSAVPPNANSAPRYEERVLARVGNLGWDTPEAEIIQRCKQVLLTCGVSEATVRAVTAPRRTGSQAEVLFTSGAHLQEAAQLVKQKGIRIVETKVVWLDVAKTRAELKPSRIVHRVAEIFGDFEAVKAPDQRREILKDLARKRVKVGGVRVMFTLYGELKWTEQAKSMFTQEQLTMAEGFAMAE